MKTILLSFILLTLSSVANSSGIYPQRPDYQITSKVKDSTISNRKAKIFFHISANDRHDRKNLIFADNSKQKTVTLNDEFCFDHTSKSGKHVYEFFLSENFLEIRTDSIKIEGGYRYDISINFKSSTQHINVRKPVIYLYPEESTEVSVLLDVKGQLTFTYPVYDNGWKMLADPDGTLHVGEDTFRYLFWESNQKFNSSMISHTSGFIIQQDELTGFLEEKLNIFGFTSQERADFITYWVPLMSDKKNLYISFLINDQCSIFADLKIKPEPAKIARFYMLWSEVDVDAKSLVRPVPQDIPTMDRIGFNVLEWGGAEIENLLFKAAQNDGKVLHNDVGFDSSGLGDQVIYDQCSGSTCK